MLVKKLIPFKFLVGMLEIVVVGVLLATSQIYPTSNGTSSSSFIIGCLLIMIFVLIQIILTIVGMNVYDTRVHFQNLICNICGLGMLVWFGLSQWQREYIWFIWGFLTVYPVFNEGMGIISVMCHNKKVVFEKYRSQQR